MKFTVTRAGEVKLTLMEGNQCGLSGDHAFSYEWQYTSEALDTRNFVVDHHEVATALAKWAKKHQMRGSCEQAAVAIGNIVLDHVRAGHSQLIDDDASLIVKLSGSVAANIKAEGGLRTFRKFSPKLHVEGRTK